MSTDEFVPGKPHITRDTVGALVWVFGAAAEVAIRHGWSEEEFLNLARWCWQREFGEGGPGDRLAYQQPCQGEDGGQGTPT